MPNLRGASLVGRDREGHSYTAEAVSRSGTGLREDEKGG